MLPLMQLRGLPLRRNRLKKPYKRVILLVNNIIIEMTIYELKGSWVRSMPKMHLLSLTKFDNLNFKGMIQNSSLKKLRGANDKRGLEWKPKLIWDYGRTCLVHFTSACECFSFSTYLMPQFVTKNQGPTFLASHKCIKTENKCYNLDVGGTKCLYLENEQGFQFHLKL